RRIARVTGRADRPTAQMCKNLSRRHPVVPISAVGCMRPRQPTAFAADLETAPLLLTERLDETILMMQTMYSSELKKAPIFVVDDEPVNLKLIERILQSDGFEDIHSIQNSEEVVARFQAVRPNLILLDINMPRLDGFAVLDKLKQHCSGSL